MDVNAYLFSTCTVVYATLSILIAVQSRQRANAVLAVCCAVTAVWAATGIASTSRLLGGPTGLVDLLRVLGWYVYLLYLYHQSEAASRTHIRGFAAVAVGSALVGLVIFAISPVSATSYTFFSWPILLRLTLCIVELLLIENLYFNLPESARWHIALPCILLAGLACFDILIVADSSLFQRPSVLLESGRVVAVIIVAPLLVLAAFRSQRWREPIRLSRSAIFHSATLVLSGSVLLSLALAGEVLRHLDETWGWVAELGLVFAGLLCIMLFISSRSARSLIDQVFVHHFFADRFDYRRQWLSCIQTLSGLGSTEQSDLHVRSIKAVADVVNSPCGAIFLLNELSGLMVWGHSWNMPSSSDLQLDHPLVQKIVETNEVVDLRKSETSIADCDALVALGPVWLAVPLCHSSRIVGVIFVGPPRIAFRLDREVFDLLGILGQEVGTYIAEQQATETVFQTRSLHDYGKRFAFVAHDIKNVSSQLALLLNNAEHHLTNPEFQQDMLATVRASVQKIDRLLKRLDEPSALESPLSINVTSRIGSLVDSYQRTKRSSLSLATDGTTVFGVMNPETFDAAVSHLINNALEAAPMREVKISVRGEPQGAIIEITDQGSGMSSDFIRDELFYPFKSRRPGGSGIGAFQARELIREAGGELVVTSQPGVGTTMRISLKHAETGSFPASSATPSFEFVGGAIG